MAGLVIAVFGLLLGVVGFVVSFKTYRVKVEAERRSRRIGDMARFIEAHRRLFEQNGYLRANLLAMEAQGDKFRRDEQDQEMELRWHLLLIDVEAIALLARERAIPTRSQTYMFGWYAKHILDNMGEQRGDPFYKLAVQYLEALVEETRKEGLGGSGDRGGATQFVFEKEVDS